MKTGKKIATVILVAVLVFTVIPLQFAAATTDIPDGYIRIYTKSDLNGIRNNLSENYILMNDIVFTESDFAPGGDYYNNGNGWKPIGGNDENSFTGTFDGNGHSITGLTITGDLNYGSEVGLFGNTSNSLICQLDLLNCNIDVNIIGSSINGADGSRLAGVGGICGWTYNSTISCCTVSGNVKAVSNTDYLTIGGIAGRTYVAVLYCGNRADVSGTVNSNTDWYQMGIDAGGIIGSGTGSQECYNTGNILGNVHSYSTKNNKTVEASVGGIAGSCNNTNNCYNTGRVWSFAETAALSDKGSAISESDGISMGGNISNCYNVGDIKAEGLAENCTYSSIVMPSAILKNLYRSTGNSERLSEYQLHQQSSYQGFDFDNIWQINSESDYKYPTLKNSPHSSETKYTAPSKIVKAVITKLPDKLNYTLNDKSGLSLKGIQVQVEYQDGTNGTLNFFDDYGYFNGTSYSYFSKPGIKTVSFTVDGINLCYDVEVTELDGVSFTIERCPTKLNYLQGENIFDGQYFIDLSGLSILVADKQDHKYRLNYMENSDLFTAVTDDPAWSIGTHNVTVYYKGLSNTYTIAVEENHVSGITIDVPPTESRLIEDYNFAAYNNKYNVNLSGLEFTVSYKDGTSEHYKYDELDWNTRQQIKVVDDQNTVKWHAGKHKCFLWYPGATAEFEIEIIPNPVSSIEIVSLPDITAYENMGYDDSGEVVKINYADARPSKIVTIFQADLVNDFMVDGYPMWGSFTEPPSSSGKYEYTISYFGLKATALRVINIKPFDMKALEIVKLPESDINGKGAVLRATLTDNTTADIVITDSYIMRCSNPYWYDADCYCNCLVNNIKGSFGLYINVNFNGVKILDYKIALIDDSRFDLTATEELEKLSLSYFLKFVFEEYKNSNFSYDGVVSGDNIDNLASLMRRMYWYGKNVYGEELKAKFNSVFGIDVDLTMSDKYDSANDIYYFADSDAPITSDDTEPICNIIKTATGYNVQYKTLNMTVSDDFIIQSISSHQEKAVKNIYLKTKPDKLYYTEDANLDLTGCVLKVYYEDGSTEEIDAQSSMISGFDSGVTGKQTVTLTYGEKHVSFSVTVLEKNLTSVLISDQPLRHEYYQGDTVDISGLKLTLCFDNGETEEVIADNSYSVEYNSTECGKQTVSVCYEGMLAEYEVMVYAFGDVNGDGAVNIKDLVHHKKQLAAGSTATQAPLLDLNDDRQANAEDLLCVRKILLE